MVFWPKEKKFRSSNSYHVSPQSFLIADIYVCNLEIDLDEWVFQFLNEDTEISVDDIHKYGVEIEYMTVEIKPKTKKRA